MTRLASILGVATVATLVLLSGCESPMKTDYAAAVAGTWMTAEMDGTVDRPPGMQFQALPEEIPVTRTATAMIVDGDGNHEGTFTLTINSEPADPVHPTVAGALQQLMATAIVTTATGTINVKNDSQMTVTIATITNAPAAFPVPEDAKTGFENIPLPVSYELKGNELKLSSAILLALEVVMGPNEKLTLTKQ